MDSQELNRACELAFRVAREGVEQDPPIDPPASMRMFLYVRQYPQRALTVARQVLSEDESFRTRVAAAATEEHVGAVALAWLHGDGEIAPEGDDGDSVDSDVTEAAESETVDEGAFSEAPIEGPVTKESIRSEMDELKSLVGQLSDERDAVGSEVEGLAGRLEEAEDNTDLSSALASATASTGATTSSSLSNQIRGLHADLKNARSERDHAQEAKELAILEHAELAEELESLRSLAGSARVQLSELESKVDAVSSEKAELETEKNQLASEREALSSDKDSLSAEVTTAAGRLVESEEKLALAEANLEKLTDELHTARSSAGVSVDELQAAVSARAAMESHVDALGGAQAKAQAEMQRVNAALSDKTASDTQKIETLKVALISVTAERDALQAKLEAVRATVTSLQGEMAKLDTNMTDAESVANVLNERMEELQTSVDAVPSEDVTPGDLAMFETPERPEIDTFVAPAASTGTEVEEERSTFEADDSHFSEPAQVSDDESHSVPTMLEESPGLAAGLIGVGAFVAVTAEDDDAQDLGEAERHDLVVTDDVVDDFVTDDVVTDDVVTDDVVTDDFVTDDVVDDFVGTDESVVADLEVDHDAELVPDEMIAEIDATEFINNLEEVDSEVDSDPDAVRPLVMSDTADNLDSEIDAAAVEEAFEADTVETETSETADSGIFESEIPESEIPETEDIDEVHALVAETVASFEPNESDHLPGSGLTAEAAVDAGASADRGGLTSLFSTDDVSEQTSNDTDAGNSDSRGGTDRGLLAAAGVGLAGAAARIMGRGDSTSEQLVEPATTESSAPGRSPMSIPGEIATDSLATARHIVNTENAVLLVDGDPVAAMGWPSVDRVEQRRNLVHYLSVMAGTSGAAPDVLLDRDFGIDRLPDSRSVRVRVTDESGSVAAQITSLIDTYPTEWPVVVVTDNMDLAAEVAMKGATLLDNGQLLDLFIAP